MRSPRGLAEDEVHVRYVFSDEVRDPRVLERYAALLTPDERARHDRFVFAKDRHQFLVTRGVIRSLVAGYLDIEPAECGFEQNEYGRPSLCRPAAAALGFNISHTRGLVACAFAREPEIGVDVEDAERPIGPDLARRFFSPSEADALEAVSDADRPARFFDYWTLKESYIKARGMGLSLPLDGFSMRLGGETPPGIRFHDSIDDDPARWQFALFTLAARYRLAVAVRRRGLDATIRLDEFRPGAR